MQINVRSQKRAKKLVLILTTFLLMTGVNKEAPRMISDWVSCIYHLVQFQKDKEIIKALIDTGSEVNIMTLAYIK